MAKGPINRGLVQLWNQDVEGLEKSCNRMLISNRAGLRSLDLPGEHRRTD